MLLTAAARCPSVLLYAAYVPGNAPKELTDAMLKNNSAPPIVDCWSVLRRTHPQAFIAVTGEEAGRVVTVLRACSAVKRAKLLMVGEPEPWVVSASRDMSRYEALGIRIEKVPQEEIRRRYAAATEADAAPTIPTSGALPLRSRSPRTPTSITPAAWPSPLWRP